MSTIPPSTAENLTPNKKPGQLLLFMLASTLGFLGVMMVLLAALNPSPPHDGPVGTVTALSGVQVGRRSTTYHYVVEFTLDDTNNTFEYSTGSALDVGDQVPLVIDSSRGTVGSKTTSTSSDIMVVGVLLVGIAVAFLSYGAHQNGSFQPALPDGPYELARRLPNWLTQSVARIVPLGMSAFLLVFGVIFGSFFLSIQLKYLTLGPAENVEIVSADLLGVENIVLTVEMPTGEQRSVTVRYEDYLLNKDQVTVFPETEPLQTRSGIDSLGPREQLLSLLVGLVLGLASIDRWGKWKDDRQSTPPGS